METAVESVLDPTGFEERAWADALAAGDTERARSAFVEALRTGDVRTSPESDVCALKRRWFDDEPGYERGFDLDPDSVVEGRHVGAYGVEHSVEEDIDWFHDATAAEGVDASHEWQWQRNRHYQWITLADAYEETGDPTYAEAFERELQSWIAACPRPADDGNYHPSAWRTIDAGIRAGWTWPYAFETFRRSEAVTDDALWRWVCSFRDHGHHLLRHVTAHNWKTMEANGLAHAGGMFPELDGATAFLSTAVDRAVAELERQCYPDGLQHELAPNYGSVALANLYSGLELADRRADRQRGGGASVPRRSRERLRATARAHARLAAPDGRMPPMHDSGYLSVVEPFADLVGGEPPWRGTDSDHLPWGGYGVLRRAGRYALLDAGPYGAAHQHQDSLQVLGAVGEEWVLTDPGGPQYTDSPITDHLRSAAAHNVALLDGERHAVRPTVHVAADPLPVALETGDGVAATAARRSFETAETGVVFDHERVLCDVADVGWLVFDRVSPRDAGEHAAEWLWQMPGGLSVDGDGATAGGAEGPSVRVEPTGTDPWTASVRAGERAPYRGWRRAEGSEGPNPLPTLSVESDATGGTEMITLLSPLEVTVDDATFEAEQRAVTVDDVTVRFGDGDDGVGTVERRAHSDTETLGLDAHSFVAD